MIDINKIKKELVKLQLLAIKKDEVPVSALITYKDKIIAKSYNKVNSTNNILDHAEIISIKKASKKLDNWRLNDCDIYITLEPCDMCKEIIKKCRFNKVFYFSKQNNYSTESNPNYNFIEDKDIANCLSIFFQSKR